MSSESPPIRNEDFPSESAEASVGRRPSANERVVALLEVLLCSDYPTQLALGATLVALGLHVRNPSGGLNVTYVVTLSLVDSVLLVGLIAFFLAAHRERFRDLLIGHRPIGREFAAGLPLAVISMMLAAAVLAAIQAFAPQLHTVGGNPLQEAIRTPGDAALFAVVIVIAGGVREEIQRAFLLSRFERWLGGGPVGVVVASVAFGAGHLLQGADAAIATGILGAFWGVIYLRRRSIVAPVVGHAGFNLLQLVQILAIGK